jgi:gliding motility-associated-like protein
MTITDTSMIPNKTCVENDVIRFKVKPNSVDTFNAFSPNYDGLNDDFYPIIEGIVKMNEFKVYNRFGQLLHSDPNAPWDGKYNGTPQPTGVYVGLLSYDFEEPRKPIVTKRKQIAITLVR